MVPPLPRLTVLRLSNGYGIAGGVDPEPILRTLIEALNRLDFLDTINREQAGDAFDDLVARAGVAKERGCEWFDEWREF